jgi:hypothetical protein
MGVNIDKTATNHSVVEVEQRVFMPYMNYGPIPEQEVLKFPALEQNAGW